MTFYKAAFSNIQKCLLAKNPFVCVTTALTIGIILSHYFPFLPAENNIHIILCLSTLFCIILSVVFKKIHIPILLFWFIIAGVTTHNIHKQKYIEVPTEEILLGKIISNIEEKPKTYKTTIEILNEEKSCKALIFIQKDTNSQMLIYGDIISLKNNFKRIENNDNATFDYQKFLENQYIFSQSYVAAKDWELIDHQNDFRAFCMQIRSASLSKLQELGLSEQNYQLIAALAFGDKSLLDDETKSNFQTAGAMHVLAVSGLHVGIINGILFFLFGFIRNKKLLWLKIACCIGGIWFYAGITGMSPSVQRASIMCTMVSLALLLKRNTSTYNALAIASFLSLLISPNDLFSVSFQLSYAAVVSIVYFGNKIQNIFHPETIIGQYLWGIIAVSISVQIGTIPLTLYYFGTIPTYSLLTNIIVIPISFVILILVITSLATSWIPSAGEFLMKILNFTTDYMQDCIADINTFPHPRIEQSIDLQYSILLYVGILLFVLFWELVCEYQKEKELFSV
ncbi:MAG: competence protein ComEC family protein [Bacteroidales bacterium]|nr:competence protein ComEC family protein [Bacteroidales bacterium]